MGCEKQIREPEYPSFWLRGRKREEYGLLYHIPCRFCILLNCVDKMELE
ncbi:hypothetical protein CEXT_192751, partial [Caerostris extrusa]